MATVSATSSGGRLARFVPAATWLRSYQRPYLRPDVVAGLTIWAVVVPQAIAYAQIAGLPPQAGLFTAFAGTLAYGLLGTSRQLVVSPTSGSAAVSAAIVAPIALDDPERFMDLSMTLAILAGAVFILLGIWKMGFVSQFVATAVQAGFLFGLGMTIIIGQSTKLFGVSGEEGNFFEQCAHLLSSLDETNGWTLAIGLPAFPLL